MPAWPTMEDHPTALTPSRSARQTRFQRHFLRRKRIHEIAINFCSGEYPLILFTVLTGTELIPPPHHHMNQIADVPLTPAPSRFLCASTPGPNRFRSTASTDCANKCLPKSSASTSTVDHKQRQGNGPRRLPPRNTFTPLLRLTINTAIRPKVSIQDYSISTRQLEID